MPYQQSADQKQTDDDYLDDENSGRDHSQNPTCAGEIPAGWFHSAVAHVSEIVISHLPGRNANSGQTTKPRIPRVRITLPR